MRTFNLGVAGIVAGAFLFGSVGSVSAIEPFDLNSVSLQLQREIRSTYIIQFQDNVAPSEVQGRANAIAARFNGRVKHTYTRALTGFSIRMNAAAMARFLEADDLGIARISRAVIMTVAQSNDNAANPDRGKPGGGGGGGNKVDCGETIGWNIGMVTTIQQNKNNCEVTASIGDVDYGTSSVKVCVLDTGVSQHSDLNMVTQLVTNINTSTSDDIYGHGTHVAGIIAAIANNDLGVVGVAPNVEITSIKVLDDDGAGSDDDVIAGIDVALGEGCNIVNMSLGGDASIPLDRAVLRATGACTEAEQENDSTCKDNNILFTLAAGNSAKDISDYSPARASSGIADNVFTIAAFGAERKTGNPEWATYSNFGSQDGLSGLVDFALPGSKINSTVPGDSYASYNGTSMAAPHMAGLLVRYLTDNGISFSDPVDIANGVIPTVGSVQRYAGFGPFLSAEEYYEIAGE